MVISTGNSKTVSNHSSRMSAPALLGDARPAPSSPTSPTIQSSIQSQLDEYKNMQRLRKKKADRDHDAQLWQEQQKAMSESCSTSPAKKLAPLLQSKPQGPINIKFQSHREFRAVSVPSRELPVVPKFFNEVAQSSDRTETDDTDDDQDSPDPEQQENDEMHIKGTGSTRYSSRAVSIRKVHGTRDKMRGVIKQLHSNTLISTRPKDLPTLKPSKVVSDDDKLIWIDIVGCRADPACGTAEQAQTAVIKIRAAKHNFIAQFMAHEKLSIICDYVAARILRLNVRDRGEDLAVALHYGLLLSVLTTGSTESNDDNDDASPIPSPSPVSRKVFSKEEIENMSISEAGLVPRGIVHVAGCTARRIGYVSWVNTPSSLEISTKRMDPITLETIDNNDASVQE